MPPCLTFILSPVTLPSSLPFLMLWQKDLCMRDAAWSLKSVCAHERRKKCVLYATRHSAEGGHVWTRPSVHHVITTIACTTSVSIMSPLACEKVLSDHGVHVPERCDLPVSLSSTSYWVLGKPWTSWPDLFHLPCITSWLILTFFPPLTRFFSSF